MKTILRSLLPLAGAVLLCSGLSLPAAQAKDAGTVFVRFNFRSVQFTEAFDSDQQQADVEAAIAKDLASRLESQFPFWSFRLGTDSDFPQLNLWIEKNHPNWMLRMSLKTDANAADANTWGTALYPEIIQPNRTQWPVDIAKTLADLPPDQQAAILSVLKGAVPLGTDAAPIGPLPPPTASEARAVLPLPWEKFCRISGSWFVIKYRWATGGNQLGIVFIHSVGVELPYDYTPGQPQFKGITVLHHDWEFGGRSEPIEGHLQQLNQLHPIEFKLEVPKNEPGGCSDQAALKPAVAP